MSRILTLTTDFGYRDAYVAIMKGVVLGLYPEVTFVDVSHQIRSQDVMEAAFVLRSAVPHFPERSVHLAIIDPGVGTSRKPIALRTGRHWFVGPDNGLFSLVLNGSEPDEIVVLDNPSFWRTPDPSTTFHGRDIFAPAAGHLLRGIPLKELGSPLESIMPLHWVVPTADEQGISGWIVHIDRFGNCITNITHELYEKHRAGRHAKCYVGSSIISGVGHTYGSVATGEPLAVFGSDGYLEVAVNSGNASELLGIRRGAGINIVFGDKR